ncbi:peptidyl-prolyl cis-trans isomerase [Vallitalea maricola]|uniref:Uncharacterized protein n=1 Tax=Vallitalea maricola TaxID=3074433 RepID=A0ACB5UHB1_9FIRM|nr:hypothetical protein AN2V17_11830 [Vallitalea sp. AN17-2]
MKNTKNKENRKRVYFFSLGIFMILLTIAMIFTIKIFRRSNEDVVVANINGEEITRKEFIARLKDHRAIIYNYFKNQYNVDDSNNFWTSEYGGEVPIEVSREKTLKELVRIKIEQSLARENGLIDDITYKEFLKKLKNENERRKKALENNEVIYGPTEYGESEYFSYTHSTMILELIETLNKEKFKPDDAELIKYYNNTRALQYKQEDQFTIEKITAEINNENKSLVFETLDKIRKNINSGESLKTITDKYENNNINLQFDKQILNENTAKMDSEKYPDIKKTVKLLAIGEISEIIEENNYFIIIRLIDKVDNGYKSFEEVKDHVRINYSKDKYEEYINSLVEEADIEINEKELNKIMIIR